MHKPFYASGFLYNLKTQQILLLQSSNQDQSMVLSMLGGDSHEDEEAVDAFRRIFNKSLNIKLSSGDIHAIYDYTDENSGKTTYVFYAEVREKPDVKSIKDDSISWVSFANLSKLSFSPNTKQDVIVGERVINLKYRIDMKLQ